MNDIFMEMYEQYTPMAEEHAKAARDFILFARRRLQDNPVTGGNLQSLQFADGSTVSLIIKDADPFVPQETVKKLTRAERVQQRAPQQLGTVPPVLGGQRAIGPPPQGQGIGFGPVPMQKSW